MAGRKLSESKYLELVRLDAEATGLRTEEVAARVGCTLRVLYKARRIYPRGPRKPHPLRLSLAEREDISRGLQAGESLRAIARRLKRAPSTISREVGAQGAHQYRAWRGERRAYALASRPKPRKLTGNGGLAMAVESRLEEDWSPEQIAKRLRVDHPNDPTMHVSHETIYKALYIQGRGALRKELRRHLRRPTQGDVRPKRGRADLRGRIPDMVEISQRPPEVEDRAIPGHWEGDLIIGKKNKGAIGTLVERSSRFVMLLHLPDGATAENVRASLTQKIQQLPEKLKQSVTWDRGKEMSGHAQFTVDTGVKVYFCDPRSPWQRGSNENMNGLLRQYFPKGEDLSQHDEAHLDKIADRLNGRPRQTLGWRTPYEALNQLLR